MKEERYEREKYILIYYGRGEKIIIVRNSKRNAIQEYIAIFLTVIASLITVILSAEISVATSDEGFIESASIVYKDLLPAAKFFATETRTSMILFLVSLFINIFSLYCMIHAIRNYKRKIYLKTCIVPFFITTLWLISVFEIVDTTLFYHMRIRIAVRASLPPETMIQVCKALTELDVVRWVSRVAICETCLLCIVAGLCIYTLVEHYRKLLSIIHFLLGIALQLLISMTKVILPIVYRGNICIISGLCGGLLPPGTPVLVFKQPLSFLFVRRHFFFYFILLISLLHCLYQKIRLRLF